MDTMLLSMFDGESKEAAREKSRQGLVKRKGKRNSSESEAAPSMESATVSKNSPVSNSISSKWSRQQTRTRFISESAVVPPSNESQRKDWDSLSMASLSSQQDLLDECHRSGQNLPPEIEQGNIEYKLKLVAPSEQRLQHLVTQLKWRLREGQGEAIYEIGVEDSGVCAGLTQDEMHASMDTLKRMAQCLNASVSLLREREVAEGRLIREVLLRKVPDEQQFLDVRVAVLGCADAGKSTLLGVLTQGELDNGRGRARLNLFRHLHEVQSGRTSSISLDFIGFDSDGKVVNYSEHTIEQICDKSTKLVTLIDLAGHQKYIKTTIFGLTGYKPHCVMLCVAANMGIVGTTREHLGLALALEMPVCMVVTKCDACKQEQVDRVLASLEQLLMGPGVRKVAARVHNEDDAIGVAQSFATNNVVPIFCVSAVNGQGLHLLECFLNVVPPSTHERYTNDGNDLDEFHVDEIFNVPNVGIVAAGLLVRGVVREGDKLLAGPDDSGRFHLVQVQSIHRNKTHCRLVREGQAASLAVIAESVAQMPRRNSSNTAMRGSQSSALLSPRTLPSVPERSEAPPPRQSVSCEDVRSVDPIAFLRKGMVLLHPATRPRASWAFAAKVYVLYHPAQRICVGFHATVHVGHICQRVVIVDMSRPSLKTTQTALVTFVLLRRPEYLVTGSRLLVRSGKTKMIGQIRTINVDPTGYERAPMHSKLKAI